MSIYNNGIILPESYCKFPLPFNDLTKVFANEIKTYGNNPWAWLHERLIHNDTSGIHIGDYIKFSFAIGDGPELEYTARIHTIYRDNANNKMQIDFWCDELLPDKIKWNDKLPANSSYLDHYFNLGMYISSIWQDSIQTCTVYHYLNALNGYICNSVTYDSNTKSTNYQKYSYHYTREDFTQTGVWNYIPQNLKTYITPKTGYCANKAVIQYDGYYKFDDSSSPVYYYRHPTIGLANLGNLWIPASYDFYMFNSSAQYNLNPIYNTIYNNYNSQYSYESNRYGNNYTLIPIMFANYYNSLDYLTKYYPEYGLLYDRNNPTANVTYWLRDVESYDNLNCININAKNKTITIANNAKCYDEKYVPLCFTIG